jgi:hypothetical protein
MDRSLMMMALLVPSVVAISAGVQPHLSRSNRSCRGGSPFGRRSSPFAKSWFITVRLRLWIANTALSRKVLKNELEKLVSSESFSGRIV